MTPEKLKEIAHEINTQDNRITADPLFCVFEKNEFMVLALIIRIHGKGVILINSVIVNRMSHVNPYQTSVKKFIMLREIILLMLILRKKPPSII